MHRSLRVSMTSRLALAGFCVLLAAPRLYGETVELTPNKDTSIFEEFPTRSNGQGPSLFAGHTRDGARRSLLAFDLASGAIPSGASITSVSLTMFLERTSGAYSEEGEHFHLHRSLSDWGEGSSISLGGQGAPAEIGDATWDQRFVPDIFWETPGGDFSPQPSASLLVPEASPEPTPQTWSSTPQLVSDVQAWLDIPRCNGGWIVLGNESATQTAALFVSRNTEMHLDSLPVLRVDYALPRPRLPGDIDFDDDVDRQDVALMAANLGMNPCSTMNDGDFTADGLVGLADLALLQSQLGQPAPSAAVVVPEPRKGLLLGAMASLILVCAYRNRARRFAA